MTTVMPRSCTSRVMAASTSSAAVGSSAEVGSSSTRIRGCAVSTEPIATRCCWPPERVRSGAAAQLGDAEQVERLLHPLAHHGLGDRELLHRVGQLLLDRVGHEAGQRVLPDHADDVGEVAGRMGAGVAAVDDHPAGEVPAGEVRHEPVDRAEQRRLAGAGRADDHAQLALGDLEVDVAEHRRRRVRVGDGDVLEADHAARSCGTARARTGDRAGRRTGGAIHAGSRPRSTAAAGSDGQLGPAQRLEGRVEGGGVRRCSPRPSPTPRRCRRATPPTPRSTTGRAGSDCARPGGR